MRTNKSAVEGMFRIFIKTYGGRVAKSAFDHGAFRLDYEPCYGGYVIEKISDDSTGVSHPFGSDRRRPTEMWDILHFALRTLESQENKTVV